MVNKVILLGNLGADPEVRYTNDNNPIATFSLATSRRYRNAQQELVTETEWHRIVVFGRSAEVAKEYLRKGSRIYLEGRLRTRKWTDQQNQDRYTTEIICESFQMLSSRNEMPGAESAPNYPQNAPAPAPKSAFGSTPRQQPTPSAAPVPSSAPMDNTFPEDDVPF